MFDEPTLKKAKISSNTFMKSQKAWYNAGIQKCLSVGAMIARCDLHS